MKPIGLHKDLTIDGRGKAIKKRNGSPKPAIEKLIFQKKDMYVILYYFRCCQIGLFGLTLEYSHIMVFNQLDFDYIKRYCKNKVYLINQKEQNRCMKLLYKSLFRPNCIKVLFG